MANQQDFLVALLSRETGECLFFYVTGLGPSGKNGMHRMFCEEPKRALGLVGGSNETETQRRGGDFRENGMPRKYCEEPKRAKAEA